MPGHTIHVLGLDLSFASDAEPERVRQAVELLHRRFGALEGRTGYISKERLLIYLALSLADDYLRDQEKLSRLEDTLRQLLSKIDDPEK